MAVPLLTKKIIKKRVKKFKRPQRDRKISVKVIEAHQASVDRVGRRRRRLRKCGAMSRS